MLVVGARQHTDLRGSVSSYCLHNSRTPVVVVPGDAPSRPQLRRRVAVGVNLTPESAVALMWASREARSRDSELVVAHAWQVAPGSLRDLTHHASTQRVQEERADEDLRNWVGDVLGPAPPTRVQMRADHGGPPADQQRS